MPTPLRLPACPAGDGARHCWRPRALGHLYGPNHELFFCTQCHAHPWLVCPQMRPPQHTSTPTQARRYSPRGGIAAKAWWAGRQGDGVRQRGEERAAIVPQWQHYASQSSGSSRCSTQPGTLHHFIVRSGSTGCACQYVPTVSIAPDIELTGMQSQTASPLESASLQACC